MSRSARARLALGALALVAILFVFVFPTRSYLAQRRQVSTEQHKVDVLREQNDKLQAEALRLQTRAVQEQMAREDFHRVYPGEQVYDIVPGDTAPPAPTSTTTP
jgi:cell division protein FtsB